MRTTILEPSGVLLTPPTYGLLAAWPLVWTDWDVALKAATAAVTSPPQGVPARVAHLVQLGLIERQWGGPKALGGSGTYRTRRAPVRHASYQ